MGNDQEVTVRRVEHEGSFYLHGTDLIDACRQIRDKSWNSGLCAAAMVMDSLCELLDNIFDESGLKLK